MPRISFVTTRGYAVALRDELRREGAMTDAEVTEGSASEVERLGFELGDIATVIGGIAAGIEALKIARALIRAKERNSAAKLEITGPSARVSVDLKGQSEEEIVSLVRSALPFTR